MSPTEQRQLCPAARSLERIREIVDKGLETDFLSGTDILAQIGEALPAHDKLACRDRQQVLSEVVEALKTSDGIGSSGEAVAVVEALRSPPKKKSKAKS